MMMAKAHKTSKKAFSKFTPKEVFEYLGIIQLTAWTIKAEPITPSVEFQTHLDRIACFDLEGSEEGKKLVIDAILTEAISIS